MNVLVAGIILSLMASGTYAGNLAQEPVVFQSGNWKVHRGENSMTDKTTCTGVYKDNFGIQLSPSDLFIKVSGGMESIQLRFDDNPPERSRQPSEVEKKIGSIVISGSEFTRAVQAGRLRTSVLTMVSGVHEDDLDLAGIGDANTNIRDGCPGDPISAQPASNQPARRSEQTGCSERAKAKMKIKGLSQGDIEDICSK